MARAGCRLSGSVVDGAVAAIDWRRRRSANLPTPDLAGLTPKRWVAQHGQVVSRAS